ncbi:hypothetical protein QTI24_31180 [Variovorax sp. J22P240]|uniref:c-type cytochrome n=1 Tax=unclassified Variovorax TaxID=663243 RepID=UPI00257814A3|nr:MULTISPECIES: hypothetical protein [unclassified Variovorax]MDM0003077.1 hypothetical protein [Variovorax sp. J22P240]MDM0050403.1 hypothetical protein [Variovorax sp. J22R115]
MTLAFAMALAGRAGLGWQEPAEPPSVSRGARLFNGTEPLAGTLSGHRAPLPAAATRCSQCHAGPDARDSPGSSFAPPLDRRELREARPRRGGPPVAYEPATFCRTLRTGVDPAHVVLPRAMPRFEVDDDQCAALWDYLTQEVRR